MIVGSLGVRYQGPSSFSSDSATCSYNKMLASITYDCISVHNRSQSMGNSDDCNISTEMTSQRPLNDSVSVIVYSKPDVNYIDT